MPWNFVDVYIFFSILQQRRRGLFRSVHYHFDGPGRNFGMLFITLSLLGVSRILS